MPLLVRGFATSSRYIPDEVEIHIANGEACCPSLRVLEYVCVMQLEWAGLWYGLHELQRRPNGSINSLA